MCPSFPAVSFPVNTLQIIILCGIVSAVVSVASILVSTSYGCDWLLALWSRWMKPEGGRDGGREPFEE